MAHNYDTLGWVAEFRRSLNPLVNIDHNIHDIYRVKYIYICPISSQHRGNVSKCGRIHCVHLLPALIAYIVIFFCLSIEGGLMLILSCMLLLLRPVLLTGIWMFLSWHISFIRDISNQATSCHWFISVIDQTATVALDRFRPVQNRARNPWSLNSIHLDDPILS